MEFEAKKKIGKAVAVAAAGMALTVMAGKIIPLNLIDAVSHTHTYASDRFATEECCGPYHQCQCPDFKGTS